MKNTVKVGIASILAIVISAILYLQTLKMSRAAYQLPRILIVIIVLLAIAMYAEEYFKSKKKLVQVDSEDVVVEQPVEEEQKIHYDRIVVFVAAITAYIFSIKILGYFIVTPVFIIGIFRYLKSVKLTTAIIIAIGFTGFVYVLFIRFLHLPIPITMF